jgi:hypothetical protein
MAYFAGPLAPLSPPALPPPAFPLVPPPPVPVPTGLSGVAWWMALGPAPGVLPGVGHGVVVQVVLCA